MGHTPEQRDEHLLCGARKRNGEACRAFAGQGTDHPGVNYCKYHGGSTRTHRIRAVRQEAQARMIELGSPVTIDPGDALLQMLYVSYGHVAWISEAMKNADLADFEERVLSHVYADERDRVHRLAKDTLALGIAARQVRLAEMYGDALATLLRGVFDDPDLALTPAQRDALGAVVRRHLSALSAREHADRPALPAA